MRLGLDSVGKFYQQLVSKEGEAVGVADGEPYWNGYLGTDQIGNYFMLRDNCGLDIEDGQVIELVDRESNPINPDDPRPSIERFIHGEIYRLRPDVRAVVHTHAPSLIPFGVSRTPLQPLYHICGFMNGGVPVFDIAKEHGMTNMLITEHKIG